MPEIMLKYRDYLMEQLRALPSKSKVSFYIGGNKRYNHEGEVVL